MIWTFKKRCKNIAIEIATTENPTTANKTNTKPIPGFKISKKGGFEDGAIKRLKKISKFISPITAKKLKLYRFLRFNKKFIAVLYTKIERIKIWKETTI